MARATRQAPDPVALERALRERPEAFDLFEALRRLECAYPERPRLGESTKPAEDALRLCQNPTLAFSPDELDRYEPADGGTAAHLHSPVLGLFGPDAPLPLHLTEYALERLRHAKDATFIAFANVFHHRALSLYYRAWADSQPTVQFDRPDEDRFRLFMGALVGLAAPHLDSRDALPDQYKRFFAGRLLSQARNAEGLRSLLERFFRVPVCVVEFVAEWMRLPRSAHLRLGSSRDVAGLGRTAVLGEYVWGTQQRFRLRLGPLTLSGFNNFLPGGEALRQVVAAVKTYVGEEKAWDVQLVLEKSEVPVIRLGQAGRMGLSTWLGHMQRSTDADDVVISPAG